MDKLLILLDELIELEKITLELEGIYDHSKSYSGKSNLNLLQNLTTNQN